MKRYPICDLCNTAIEGEDFERGFIDCKHQRFSRSELRGMGLEPELAELYVCGSTMHTTCADELVLLWKKRDCCEIPQAKHTIERCFNHTEGWVPGFVCVSCEQWHQLSCANEGLDPGELYFPSGICSTCAHAGKAEEVAIRAGEWFKNLQPEELEDVEHILASFRKISELRIPHSWGNGKYNLIWMRRYIERILQKTERLESGLEREFLDLLVESVLEDQFENGHKIELNVADRSGSGRKDITIKPDFLHLSLPYVVFLDGRTYHSSEKQLADDAEITTELSRKGYIVRRFRIRDFDPERREQTRDLVKKDLEDATHLVGPVGSKEDRIGFRG